MAEYIERESAVAFAQHAYNEWNLAMAAADGQREIKLVYKRQELCKAVKSVFSDMPAADVAPVVRCRECKHFNLETHECENELLSTDHEGGASYSLNFCDDDFCSYGERAAGGK